MKELSLRPLQVQYVNKTHEALRRVRKVCAVAPTGFGKRYVLTWWALKIAEKGKALLVVTNRRILVDQMAAECRAHGISCGVLMGDSPRNDEALVQIASLQTLQSRKWKDMPQAAWLAVDECFVGNTLISTPSGDMRIDEVRPGMVVYCASGLGVVQSVSARPCTITIEVELSNGRIMQCTERHPIFTERGWVKAKDLDIGAVLFGKQDVSDLWGGVHALEEKRGDKQAYSRSVLERASRLLAVLRKEVEEPDVGSKGTGENASDIEANSTSTDTKGRQRQASSAGAVGSAACLRGGVGSRGSDPDEDPKGKRISYVLQGGYWESREEGCNRGRRLQSRVNRETTTGCEENGTAGPVRVVRVSRLVGQGTRTVFNLHVSGHPSYFANGVLVHNCHNDLDSYAQLFELHPNAKIVGVTATPVGPQGKTLIGLYDEIVEPVLNSELIQQEWLLKTFMIAPEEPDIEGVSIVDGKEFNQVQLGERVEDCIVFANVFEWWKPYSEMQTLCFAPRVKFAYGIAEQFQQQGFTAEVIEANTREEDRKRIIQGYRDGEIRVLCAVDILREGFDAPIAQVGIDLQPNNQLRTWWQKLGRVRRPHEGQDKAVWLDFAGNAWRHVLHPDEDPPWQEVTVNRTIQEILGEKAGRVCSECGSKDVFKGVCQDCGHEVEPRKKPWMCPKCRYTLSPWEHMTDGRCPNCGTKSLKPTRRIRMGDGTLKVVSAEQIGKRRKEKATKEQAAWDQCRYKAHYSKKSLDFARWLYKEMMGEYPPRGLKDCPEPDSGDWKLKPGQVFPHMNNRGKKKKEPVA